MLNNWLFLLFLAIPQIGHAASSVVTCLDYTYNQYHVPKALILAIHHVEGGRLGTIAENKNGSFDLGPMQINSATMADLTQYGVNSDLLLNSYCGSFHVAAWKLATSYQLFNSWLLAIAAYNCGDGAVAKALRRAEQPVELQNLSIPTTTKNSYLPRVLQAWRAYSARFPD